MAVCSKCSVWFVGTNCGSCGWQVIYKCWKCRTKIDPAKAQACACRWFKCPKCSSCGCDADRPKTREQRIVAALNSATRKFDLARSKPEQYGFLLEPSPIVQSNHDAWSEWPALKQFPWEYFVTLTLPRQTNVERASQMWHYYTNRLARISLSARDSRKVGIPWVNSVELHESGNPHIHALIAHVSNINPKVLRWMWGLVAGRFDTQVFITNFDATKPGLRYVTKSANDFESHIEVSRFFSTACSRASLGSNGSPEPRNRDVFNEGVSI